MAIDSEPTTSSGVLAGTMALLVTLALAGTAASPASAATPPAPQPAAFALSAPTSNGTLRLRDSAGHVVRGAVLVRNLSRRPITVILQAADIDNASNGNADFITKPVRHVGRWLRLAARRVRLAPYATRRIAFAARVPAGTRGASHYGGIVAINAAELAVPAARKHAAGRTFSFFRVNRQALAVTIRLPGRLSRALALRSVKISVAAAGAGLALGLLPGGTVLIEGATVRLRVLRHARTIFMYSSTLGQLFPGSLLNFQIPWRGRPTPGTYRVQGVIRPQGAAAIHINRTIEFTSAKAVQLTHESPAGAQSASSGTPPWVWPALAVAAALLIALSVAVWKLAQRPRDRSAVPQPR